MFRKSFRALSASAALVATLALAHHGWSSFDQDRPLYLEWNVWRAMSMLDDGAIQAFAHGDQYGQIRMACVALSIPYSMVAPISWKKAMAVPTGKDAARQRAIQVAPWASRNSVRTSGPPEAFRARYADELARLKQEVAAARELLPQVAVSAAASDDRGRSAVDRLASSGCSGPSISASFRYRLASSRRDLPRLGLPCGLSLPSDVN